MYRVARLLQENDSLSINVVEKTHGFWFELPESLDHLPEGHCRMLGVLDDHFAAGLGQCLFCVNNVFVVSWLTGKKALKL